MTKKAKAKLEEWLDDEGYPTDEALDRIAEWPRYYDELLAFVRSIWRYAERGYYAEVRDEESGDMTYRLSTAEWTGNQEVIDALRENKRFWRLCWFSSQRGGHFVFQIPAIATRAKWGGG